MEYILSATTSAICTKTFVAPLERMKMLKQSQLYYKEQNYSTIFKSIKYIYKHEGPLGFYRGNLSNITRIVPSYVLKFPLNEFYKTQFFVEKHKFKTLLLSGIFAGFTQVSITYPLDILRTRMTLDKKMTSNYNTITSCARNILNKEGIAAFYNGFSIALVSYPLYIGIQFSIYEYLKEDFSFFAGSIAGLISQSLMYPGDTIKRQLQLNGLDNTKMKYNTVLGCIRFIYKKYGFPGFYPGFSINLLKSIPEVTLQFFIYESCMKLFNQKNV